MASPNKNFESELAYLLKKIKLDLILGSANKPSDIRRTSFFSDVALDYARLKPSYIKGVTGFKTEFQLLLVNPNQETLAYVDNGVQGKFARAGNCQEKVGLAIYYLMKKNKLWRQIDVVTLDECFDHVFLKIITLDNKFYYFDPWAEMIFYDDIKNNLLAISKQILQGFSTIIKNTTLDEERKSFEEDVEECERLLEIGGPKITTEETFFPKQAGQYIKQFDEYFELLINELYPSSFQPKH